MNSIFQPELAAKAQEIYKKISNTNLQFATAESCTGGLISAIFTEVNGISSYFRGGITAYHNDIKINLLEVPEEIIKQYGAVSPDVAEIMARNCAKILQADLTISVTGIAGPSGGSAEKPVGLVYIGRCYKNEVICKKYNLSGDRVTVRNKAANAALDLMIEALPS